ncbi:hypothetical protein [Agrobacterium vitis]|uniref:Lipoprotein n=1 Tax=Agrobacterium vitis TaxID=373 RepID=A0ABW9TEM5_AGRVI|nr:hypothetical protein [Agrobacterium vitis]MUO42998.1 hypothetical protein [Agrobacterium vitis]
MKKLLLSLMPLILCSCGTYTPAQVAKPSEVSLRAAVFDVADTLRDVQGRVPPEKKTGLLVDEVTVVFNVAASATKTDKAGLSISNVPLAAGTVGVTADSQNAATGSRGNTVTIKFKNVATADMSKSSVRPTRVCEPGEAITKNCINVPFFRELSPEAIKLLKDPTAMKKLAAQLAVQ